VTAGSEFTSISLTSTYLLDGLKDPANQEVWKSYVDRYRPLLVRYGVRLGLPESDADDAAQQTLVEFYTAFRAGKYDRDRGRLREWLFGIARNQALNQRRKRATQGARNAADRQASDSDIAAIADEQRDSAIWEEEWRAALLRQCMAEVRYEVQPGTFEAFELFAVQGWPAERVAAHLKITPNAVFGAKRRILRRIRELLPNMERTW